MWKSAPYAAIAMIPATIYTYLAVHDYAVGPMAAAVVVSIIGYYGWTQQGNLNKEITKSRIEAEEVAKQLARRIVKVEAEFINIRPSGHLYYYENMLFDEAVFYQGPGEFAPSLIPQLLEDMTTWDQDLVRLLKDFHKASEVEYARLLSFREKAKTKLEECDKLAKVQGQQPAERMPAHIQGLYYVLSGIVVTPLDVVQQQGTVPRIRVPRPAVGHFIQLLYDKEDASNPYPSLLRDKDLRETAVELENARKSALEIFTVVDHIIKVVYGEIPGFQPGLQRAIA
jgi:hypothetical protein